MFTQDVHDVNGFLLWLCIDVVNFISQRWELIIPYSLDYPSGGIVFSCVLCDYLHHFPSPPSSIKNLAVCLD